MNLDRADGERLDVMLFRLVCYCPSGWELELTSFVERRDARDERPYPE